MPIGTDDGRSGEPLIIAFSSSISCSSPRSAAWLLLLLLDTAAVAAGIINATRGAAAAKSGSSGGSDRALRRKSEALGSPTRSWPRKVGYARAKLVRYKKFEASYLS